LISSHVIVFTDHVALKHLLSKKDAKPRLVRWMLLLQEINYEIRVRRVLKTLLLITHLGFYVLGGIEAPTSECFPDEPLFIVQPDSWYADIMNYLVTEKLHESWSKHDRDRFLHLVKFYIWDDPYMIKYCFN